MNITRVIKGPSKTLGLGVWAKRNVGWVLPGRGSMIFQARFPTSINVALLLLASPHRFDYYSAYTHPRAYLVPEMAIELPPWSWC